MEGVQTPALQPTAATRPPRGRQPRGSRSSRARGGRHHHNQQHAPNGTQVVTTPNSAAPDSSPAAGGPLDPNSRGGRGRRGVRGSRRGGDGNSRRAALARPRTFGGHLTGNTRAENPESASSAGLDIDAPEFIPGQPPPERSENASRRRQVSSKTTREALKSTAEDLPTRIHEDISSGQYECVICTNEVLRSSKVWSCSICWTVTHMSCVKKWFSNRTMNPDQQQFNWRCPGCNSTMMDEPNTYHCWCGKEINPKSIPGLSPHGCGQTCSNPRGTCPHPCPLECHAGPCPPCTLMGPSQSCFCGKHTSTKRCGETDYAHGWSCHEVCGDLLPCGEHECHQECHSGLCGSCEVLVFSRCYCGRESKSIPCDRRGDKLESYNYAQIRAVEGEPESDDLPESWFWGSFGCETVCGRPFDCQKHLCRRGCHPQDESPARCPFSPDLVTHCPCGKTPLVEVSDRPRTSCEDPIPNCKKLCNKQFLCGHFCQETCHTGPCKTCLQKMEITCRCGRTKGFSVCHQGVISAPQCMRICRAQLNCGRHEHGEHCCPGEKKAAERVAAKRKNRNAILANDEVEAEHICTRTCGRELKCGRHQCQQLCHRGPCSSCPEAIFEEISCNCGRTVLQPPQPCGTKAPACHFDCIRRRSCGHPQVSHSCHPDDDLCPKCPFLVEKPCICGKKRLKNQPCWFEEPRCGLPCDKKLKCGTHTCKKTCHRPGECEDADMAGSRCKQPCGKMRNCGHLDTEPCHSPSPCKEDKPCTAKTFVTCDCQRKKQEVRCMATKANPSPRRELLNCDDECLRLQRNRLLADALNIDPSTHTDDHVPYSDTTLRFFKESPQFAQTYEREYRVFAGDPTQKSLRFKPMKSSQRAFLHSLAEDFGFDSESADPEPHRHVCLFKTPRFVSAPMKTLAQCAKIRASAAASLLAQPSALDGRNTSTEHPYNALLLFGPRFGLTVEELDAALQREYAAYPDVKFHTSFLPSDEVVIKGGGVWTPQILESSLSSLKPTLSQVVRRQELASGVSLCHVDDSLNVLRRERDAGGQREQGWSAVVSRSTGRSKPAAATAAPTVPISRNFVALKKEPKKKAEEQPVEEDWEIAAEKLDEETATTPVA
ncbi:hypothetical protein GGS23DRAFT_552891 [Durotheca rogersii]|uniref:uncharacterized protein n=1 Tax=Durotheca rogersii TaxID=419775 RepID=UPI0022204E3A|nr:uncharacterized protein GGS23DRAFT_552891 [Durotheca rogersii]KAI5866959.1 hypothetical protein GGS23DRAFT_552891 [Durotheca rogersii]